MFTYLFFFPPPNNGRHVSQPKDVGGVEKKNINNFLSSKTGYVDGRFESAANLFIGVDRPALLISLAERNRATWRDGKVENISTRVV